MAKKNQQEPNPSQNPEQEAAAAKPEKASKAAKPEKEDATFFGAGDKDKQYPIASVNKDQVVVRQVNVQLLNGGMVEVPNTMAIQTYNPKIYDQLLKNNFFGESKIKVEVLHDPR
jgi:hypothetical protein